MKNITMFENIESLKKTMRGYTLISDFELFSVLIKTAKSYHVVTIQYDLYEDSFYISHPSYNFSFEDVEMYAILGKE
jgi:hypothetical protein